jgi:hypothetical protein
MSWYNRPEQRKQSVLKWPATFPEIVPLSAIAGTSLLVLLPPPP